MESQKLEYTRHSETNILIGNDILKSAVSRCSRLTKGQKCAVITNSTVAKWYLEPLKKELEEKNFKVFEIILPDGEQYKTFETVSKIISELAKNEIDKSALIIGLGGGVVCDLAGFSASIYKRGTPLVLIPTTLLAMVDASFGGKNGVNIEEGKNLAGTVYQPSLTCIDINMLKTLPLSQISYGTVESIKHGLIYDVAYYKFICENIQQVRQYDLCVLQRLVRRSVYIKKTLIADDELDISGKRCALNFGHTFGHALEAAGKYVRLNHCEAVGLGMLMAIKAAEFVGMLKDNYIDQLKEVLRSLDLPTTLPPEFNSSVLLKYIRNDKKRTSQGWNFILPVELGKIEQVMVDSKHIESFIAAAMCI